MLIGVDKKPAAIILFFKLFLTHWTFYLLRAVNGANWFSMIIKWSTLPDHAKFYLYPKSQTYSIMLFYLHKLFLFPVSRKIIHMTQFLG